MSKTAAIAKKYRCLYPDQDVTFKGAWITIEGKAYRSKEVKQMIDEYNKAEEVRKTLADVIIEMNEEEVEGEKVLELTEVIEPEPMVLLKQIYDKADAIRHSSIVAKMRKDGHDIAKLAKRLMNIMEE